MAALAALSLDCGITMVGCLFVTNDDCDGAADVACQVEDSL